jgi:uncharacterized protein
VEWYNEPRNWVAASDSFTVTTDPKTDFWRKTHYGFIRDNGHFYYEHVHGNFDMQVQISGQYKDLYDQAGVMVRLDDSTWVKTGIEYVDEAQNISAVVTREFSDWSVVPLDTNPASIWLKLSRRAEAIEIHYSMDGTNYKMLRMLYLSTADALQAGIMCASPEGSGFTTVFNNFSISHT